MNERTRAALTERLELLGRIRTLLEAEYEGAGHEFCVRRLEAAEHVARGLRVPVSGLLIADVTLVARGMGWTPVRPLGRRLYAGVKRRALTESEALDASRELRRDPREHQARRR